MPNSATLTTARPLWFSSRLAFALLAAVAACDDGSIGEPPFGTDGDPPPAALVTIAFIGDQGYEPAGSYLGPRAVLRLIREEGAHAVMHQGDFDYGDDPAAWLAMIDAELGPDFPYFVSVGNHDIGRWDDSDGYRRLVEKRLSNQNILWEGQLGEMSALHFRGIYLLFGAPGTLGSDPTGYADYFESRLASDTSIWSVCSWHKNQRLMQVGGKGDETGWEVYERCRQGGAIIATAHEHSYSRTHLLSHMETQQIASTSDTLLLSPGETFAFVSGLGGRSIRDQELGGDWWGAIYTSDQGANYGALFGRFGVEDQPDLAYFYFKDIDGRVADEFWVRSGMGLPDPGIMRSVRRIADRVPGRSPSDRGS